ncbi:MAG: hypothetical protein KKG59_05545 [Nanoarchaeota archaeon]|nr:hypothetical protein [Nanoarchaeota archaeon]
MKIKATALFKKQVSALNQRNRRIIYEKIELLKENPYRYKKIRSKKYSRVFRIRLNIEQKETRLIYVVLSPNIILVCLLERKGEYKNLEKYLKQV